MSFSEEYRSKKKKSFSEEYFQEKGIDINTILKDDEKEDTDNNSKSNTFFKKSNLFSDNKGNVVSDVVGTAGATLGDVGINVVKGIMGLGEGIGDLITYGRAGIAKATGNTEKSDELKQLAQRNRVDEVFEPIDNKIDGNSILGEKSDSIAQGLGYIAGTVATAGIGGAVGGAVGVSSKIASTVGSTASIFASSMGQGMTEAYNDGADDDDATKYGAISAIGESGSELLFGGLGKASKAMGLSKGTLDDVITKSLTKDIKNKMVKTLSQSGIKAAGEGFEEVISGLVSAAGKKATYMSDEDFKSIAKDENLAEQFWMGALTSAIAQAPGTIKSVKKGTDYLSGKTENEQKVYDNEINSRVSKKIRETTIENEYNKQLQTQENLGIELTDDTKNKIYEKVEKAYDNGTLNGGKLSKKDRIKIEEEVENDMNDGNISSESIMKVLGENQDLSKDKLLMKSMYENEQKYNSYQYEKTDNEKVNTLLQSATEAGLNNTTKTKRKVELISKLVQDTDRQYKFVSREQLKQMGYNENANGLMDKSTGEILINAQTDKGIQSIVGHETTHIFDGKNEKGEYSKEYQDLQNMVIEYAVSKGLYKEKVQNITESYGDLLVDESQVREELTADLVGDFLFNDEKFIEHLATKDRNVFQRIYDYVKHTYKMITAKTEDAKDLERLKYQFDKVYKTIQENNNTDTKYAIAGKEGMNNAIRKDTDYLKLERAYNKAQQMQKIGMDNEYIRKNTDWFQDKNGDWKFEFSDKDMELKNINLKKDKTYKLGDILKHDKLFTIYPKLADYEVKFTNLNKASGSYNKIDKNIKLNNRHLDKKQYKNSIEGTLIHEIQHAIQDIENFEGGRSSKGSRLAYYEKLGEIEASDTKSRFIKEKYKNIDLTGVAPESSKTNPKHPKLDNYLKNRKLLDKAKDSVYNYIKKRMGDNNEFLEENISEDKKQNMGLVDGRKRRGYVNESFESNQEKISPNINLSLTNDVGITGDDIAVKDLLVQERPTENLKNENNDINEKKTNLKTKARNYISRSRTKLKNDIVFKFGTSKYANTTLLNDIVDKIQTDIQNGELTQEKADSYFDELYGNLKKVDTEYYDEYKALKKDIQNTKFYIPDNVKNDIADYNEFRQNNMGNIIMTNNSENITIASKYSELSELYPDLFPKDIINESEMLKRIADVTKDIKKVETNVSAYNDEHLGKEYRMWAKEEFKASLGDFRRDVNNAMRYNAETTLKEKQLITKDIAKELYKAIPNAKKKYEKALAKEVLTKNDKIQVDRLLNGEIGIDELPKDSNKEGIIRLATAKSEYNAIQKTIDRYVKEIKEKRLEEAEKDVGDLSLWKDKKSGWRYSRETAVRNIYDIAPKDVAERISNKYFRSYIEVNEKKVIDNINKYNDRVRTLNIDTNKKYKLDINGQKMKVTESGLIQLLGEKKISIENIKEAGANTDKIEKCVNEFRNIYNELIEAINDSMIENGYAPMEYRKDYFPHFTEDKPDTLLGKAAKLFGINITNEELPTDISGQTMNFRPGRTWFGNMLQRTTDITDYDVLKGFDKYIRGASDLIYHTNDIQNLRALSKVIRGTYNDTEIQNKITEIEESTDLDIFEKAEKITEIKNTAKDKSHLSKFVEWLDNYTNLLAGKKAINDRGAEKELNRKMYKTMQAVESRFAANAIGGNVGVALSNIGPYAQAVGETRPDYLIRGMWQTMKNSLINDQSFVSESSFITRRRGANYLSQTTMDKVTSAITKPLDFVDNFVSESIVRAKYLENLSKGMSEQVALEKADQYAAGLMADRGRGALPTQFSNKNPGAKMINMFQVEVNNQWSYYFKDLPRNVQEDGKKSLTMSFAKIMVGSYLINNLIESIRGSRVMFDPIYIVKELIQGLSDDDDDNDADSIWNALTNILGNIPGASMPATVLGIEDVGRVPISGMVPDLKDIIGNVTDVVNNEKTLSAGAKDIGKELLDTIGSSLILPIGGAQIKKTIKGIGLYTGDKPVAGSYNENGDLKYSVDKDIGSIAKSAVFGAYANPYAQDYINSGYKTIKSDNINEMVGLDMNSTEYRNYKTELNKAGNVSDKNGYKQYTDNSGNIYWYDKDNDIVYNSDYQKTVINKDDLTKVSKKEEQLKYINSLDITNNKKQIMTDNLTKDSKKYVDIKEYGNYGSYEEYTYARDNPRKYKTISQICSYDDFKTYKKEIENIAENYKTETATTSKEKTAISKQKKKEIQNYINSLSLEPAQKMMLEKEAGGYSIKNYKKTIENYLNTTNLTTNEKYNIWNELFE